MATEKKAAVLTDAEFRRVLAVTRTTRHASRNIALLYFSFGLGLRVKELASLRVSDVLQQDGELRTEILLTSRHTKGGKQRAIYLANKDARRALAEYLQARSKDDFPLGAKSALFKSAKGGAFTPNTLQMLFKHLFVMAGITTASSHSGRRTFATSLIERGVDIKAVATLMGHQSVSMTARYVDDNPARLQRICQDLRFGVDRAS